MGMFDFLKKKRDDDGMSNHDVGIPPMPSMPNMSDDLEHNNNNMNIPPPPQMNDDAPLFPEVPKETLPVQENKENIYQETKSNDFSQHQNMNFQGPQENMSQKPQETFDEIPDTIPDLEDLPEPPRAQKESAKDFSTNQFPKEEIIQENNFGYNKNFASAGIDYPEKEQVIKKHTAVGPIFMKIEEFREVLGAVDHIKNSLKEGDNNFVRMNDYKSDQDKLFEKIHETIEDIQRKLLYNDKILFER